MSLPRMEAMTIFLLHQHRYWTEYLEALLEDTTHFSLIKSGECADATYKGRKLPTFNPSKHKTLLCAGRLVDPTNHNFIVCRFQHSPGFGILPIIFAYSNLLLRDPTSDFRLLIFREHFKLLSSTEHLDTPHDHFRYQLLSDPRVSITEVDPILYNTKLTPKTHSQKPGTGLLALSWKVSTEDPQRLGKILSTLAKELRLSIVIHPMTPHFGNPNFVKELKEHAELQNVYFDVPRKKMIDLYDQHEFIITDGSGSCYEAILRGCKPLLIADFSYLKNNQEFHSAKDGGYLPFQEYTELPQYRPFDADTFIANTYPFLSRYSYEEAKKILREEIINASIR